MLDVKAPEHKRAVYVNINNYTLHVDIEIIYEQCSDYHHNYEVFSNYFGLTWMGYKGDESLYEVIVMFALGNYIMQFIAISCSHFLNRADLYSNWMQLLTEYFTWSDSNLTSTTKLQL